MRLSPRATRVFSILAVAAGLANVPALRAQFWQQDTAFAPLLESPAHPGDQKITALVRQPDGKLLAAGYVERANGQARANPSAPLRFNADGTLDTSFQASDSAAGLFLQPSGKIVTPEGERLNADGSRDLTFELASGLLRVAGMDPMGRLYVRRDNNTLVRTTPDGVTEWLFSSPASGVPIGAVAPFADGSSAVVLMENGVFHYNSVVIVVRVRADGTQDPAFRPYIDPVGTASFLGAAPLPDGRVLLYGTSGDQREMRFVRLGLDGAPDYTYLAPAFTSTATDTAEALTLAGVLFDLLRDAHAPAGTRISTRMSTQFARDQSTAALDVGTDGTLWLATKGGTSPGGAARYTRSSTTDLTIDPRPTIPYDPSPATLDLEIGEPGGLAALGPGGLLPVTYQWLKDGLPLPGATGAWLDFPAPTASDSGTYAVRISNAYGSVTSKPTVVTIDTTPKPAAITPHLPNSAVVVGSSSVGWSAYATGNPYPTITWTRNGAPLSGGVQTTNYPQVVRSDVQIPNVQPEHAGIYQATATNGASSQHTTAILGVLSDQKTAGAATEVGHDIVHPNKNVYDQVLMTGAAAAVTADANQVTRVSFVDLTGDIVQVEMSGAGTLTLVLANAGTPAPAANYNQPGVQYVRGHPGLVVAGADETTNLSVFSVGRVTAVNQALFRDDVDYDGLADVAFIAILTTDGRFGGLRTANVRYYADKGLTGVYAPGVTFAGPVYVGDIDAFDTATPVLVLKSAQDLRITGGDLKQTNGQPVRIGELTPGKFTAGTTSHGEVLPAQPNRGTFQPFESP